MTTKTKTAIDELKEFGTWVAYKLVPSKSRPGKMDKLPVNPHTGDLASSTDMATWGSCAQAKDRAKKDNLPGVGFVFTELSGIVGIDLDGCIDTAGNLEPWAADVVKTLDSYTELSPSGTGLHIFAKGTMPEAGRRTDRIEMYKASRFFTITGKHWPGCPQTIQDRPQQILDVYDRYFSRPEAKPAAPICPVNLADVELIEKIRQSAQGAKFDPLWAGKWQGDYPSQSEADMALCAILAYWTGNDAGRIDRLFRDSGLYRDKWDRADYRQGTIDKTYSAEVYNPPAAPAPNGNGKHQAESVVQSEPNNEQQTAFKRYTVFEYQERPRKKWLIDNVLGEQDIIMIYGEAATGKTFVVLNLAYAAALGRNFGQQFDTARPLKVAYCAGEGQGGLVNRLTASTTAWEAWQGENRETLTQNLSIFADVPQLYNSEIPQGIYNFVEEWQTGQAGPLDVLVIDTLHSATYGADENNAKDAGLIIRAAKYAREVLGCAVILVHHANRAGKYRGSSAFHGDLDAMIETRYDKDIKVGTLEAVKVKDKDLFTLYFKLAYDPAAESCAIEWLDRESIQLNEKPKKGDIAKEAILELLRSNVALNQSQIVNQLKDDVGRHTILAALKELEQDGVVASSPGEKNGKVYQLRMDI